RQLVRPPCVRLLEHDQPVGVALASSAAAVHGGSRNGQPVLVDDADAQGGVALGPNLAGHDAARRVRLPGDDAQRLEVVLLRPVSAFGNVCALEAAFDDVLTLEVRHHGGVPAVGDPLLILSTYDVVRVVLRPDPTGDR